MLKLLASAPDGLTLSELARGVAIHRSSCQTLLLGLCNEGLATRREPGPIYRLGPALLGLGAAAQGVVDPFELVDDELERLHEASLLSTMAGVAAGDSVLVANAYAIPHPFGHSITRGTRIPLRAPIGALYLAWAERAVVQAWLLRADPPLTSQQTDHVVADLGTIRRRGWSATIRSPARAPGSLDIREVTDEELTRRQTSTVIGVSSPIWDQNGMLVCSVAVVGGPTPLPGPSLRQLGNSVLEAAARVTDSLGGQQPRADARPTSQGRGDRASSR